MTFRTQDDVVVPAVTAEQMREVDRLAVEEFGLGILQMMENAGRNLAENALDMLEESPKPLQGSAITILAGSGGNGGGGLCCARHLHNHGFTVQIVVDRDESQMRGAARKQFQILQAARIEPVPPAEAEGAIRRAHVVVDALIGYGLHGAAQGRTAELIEKCNRHATRVLSLDVPSGLNATTGKTSGAVVHPDRTLTLALPKVGLYDASGDLYLADIGIPPELYRQLGISFKSPFEERYWIRLTTAEKSASIASP